MIAAEELTDTTKTNPEPPLTADQWTNQLNSDTKIELRQLVSRIEEEEEQYIVGRLETSDFVALPLIGGEIIEHLQAGRTPGQIEALLQEKYGAAVELDEFIADLIALDFVQSIDGQELENKSQIRQPSLPWLKPEHVQWLFSGTVRFLLIGLIVAGGITLLNHPYLFPLHGDYFWTDASVGLLTLVNIIIFFGIVISHETAHLVVARAVGVPAQIRFGTRLSNLVMETDVSGLWAMPRKKRYPVYLAGMLWNLAVVSVALIILAYFPTLPERIYGLLELILLFTFYGTVYEFYFYMRTDIYFVVLDLLHCYNLFEDGMAYLGYAWQRIRQFGRRQSSREAPAYPLAALPQNEQVKVKIYSLFIIGGSGLALLVFFLIAAPIIYLVIQLGFQHIAQGAQTGNIWLLIDGLIAVAIEFSLLFTFVVTFVKHPNRRPKFAAFKNSVLARFTPRTAASS